MKIPSAMPSVTETAWLGIDSKNGRYYGSNDGSNEAIENGIVAPGGFATIQTTSHAMFRSERMFVRRACASDFLIHHLFVGQRAGAIVNMVPIIAEAFAVEFDALPELDIRLFDGSQAVKITVNMSAVELLGAPMNLPTIRPGIPLLIDVENIGREPSRFLGALLGKAQWQ